MDFENNKHYMRGTPMLGVAHSIVKSDTTSIDILFRFTKDLHFGLVVSVDHYHICFVDFP